MMCRNRRIRLLGAGLLVVMGLGLASSWAQAPAPGSNILRIRGKLIPTKEKTPVYQTSVRSQTSGRPPEWWRVAVEYETAPEWIDELEFTFYAYLEDQSAKNAPEMFRGVVTYENVPKGRHVADIFLHPNVVARMGQVKQVALVIKHNGMVVATDSTSSRPNWWDGFPPKDGVLLNRTQTPFALVDYDSYNFIRAASPAR